MHRREILKRGAAVVATASTLSVAPPTLFAHASAPKPGRILIVMTSTGKVPGSDRPTGLWWSEYSEPLRLFKTAGFSVDVASINGGPVPIDPRSGGESRAQQDVAAWTASRSTIGISSLSPDTYLGVFLPGGHGTMWDFPENPALAKLISRSFAANIPIGSVCHGPAGLLGARRPDGRPIVEDRRVNGFTNAEEAAAGMTGVVPFLLQTRLQELGGRFEHAAVFAPFAVSDGNLITGQNPASSERSALLLLDAISARSSAVSRS